MHRSLLSSILAAGALALSAGTASAADTVVAPDAAAQRVTALDGTVVWVTGGFGHQKLMQRTPDGTISAVKGTREARSYPSIDLGHNSDGDLLLTYLRCDAPSSCVSLWNDLDGRRATFRGYEPRGCRLTTTVSQWRTHYAYGLACTRNGKADNARTGLYVKARGHSPRQLHRPKDAIRFGAREITAVDIRSTRVAAIASDIYEYAFSQTLTGTGMVSVFAAASEGDSDEHARSVALGTANTLWALTDAEHLDDPKESVVFRVAAGCERLERIDTPSTGDFAAGGLAVDGDALYLLVPGVGITQHAFVPAATPTC